MEIEVSETVSIASLNLNEAWLQERIWETPSALGLGELESVNKEHAVSSGGRLDILLKDPVYDVMYEVEVMLGDTDPSHIIRTIEYWDLVKRRFPQRQHFAVLIAERITCGPVKVAVMRHEIEISGIEALFVLLLFSVAALGMLLLAFEPKRYGNPLSPKLQWLRS